MKDLQYYLGLLDEREATCLVLLDEKIIYESQEDRLKPLLAIISDRDLQEKVKGAVLVDRVIGKSAYGLASTLGFSHIYTPLYSAKAREIEVEGSPQVNFETEVPHICNNAGDGWCPMENLVKDAETVDETVELLFEKIGIRPA